MPYWKYIWISLWILSKQVLKGTQFCYFTTLNYLPNKVILHKNLGYFICFFSVNCHSYKCNFFQTLYFFIIFNICIQTGYQSICLPFTAFKTRTTPKYFTQFQHSKLLCRPQFTPAPILTDRTGKHTPILPITHIKTQMSPLSQGGFQHPLGKKEKTDKKEKQHITWNCVKLKFEPKILL